MPTMPAGFEDIGLAIKRLPQWYLAKQSSPTAHREAETAKAHRG